jgi:hypothetical protein
MPEAGGRRLNISHLYIPLNLQAIRNLLGSAALASVRGERGTLESGSMGSQEFGSHLPETHRSRRAPNRHNRLIDRR